MYDSNINKYKILFFISGGTNAFHFLSFVAGVLNLIVNVNNNINNNNVNVNGINANANSNQNSDANVNNNAANVIMVMPGKKRKKKWLIGEFNFITAFILLYEIFRIMDCIVFIFWSFALYIF